MIHAYRTKLKVMELYIYMWMVFVYEPEMLLQKLYFMCMNMHIKNV